METTAKATILDGVEVTFQNYHSARLSLAINETRRLFGMEVGKPMPVEYYVFALAEGSLREANFDNVNGDNFGAELFKEYWQKRDNDIAHNWQLFMNIEIEAINQLYKAHRETRREQIKGEAILETQPDPDTDPKAGKSGKKRLSKS